MSTLTDEIARRRTFAIISNPDAGKTTLTEKLLLFGRGDPLVRPIQPVALAVLLSGDLPGDRCLVQSDLLKRLGLLLRAGARTKIKADYGGPGRADDADRGVQQVMEGPLFQRSLQRAWGGRCGSRVRPRDIQ